MTYKQLSYGILRALGIVALVCLALYFLWEIRSVFAYLAIAFVLAMIGRPLMNLMNSKLRIPNSIGAIITITILLVLIVAFISLFISLVLNEPYRFIGNFIHLDRFEDAIAQQIKLMTDSLGFLNMPLLEDYVNDAVKNVDVKSFSSMFGGSITGLGMIM